MQRIRRDRIKETNRFKIAAVKFFCKLFHLISEENYEQCVVDILGYSPAGREAGGGGGGGSIPEEEAEETEPGGGAGGGGASS